MRAAVVAIVIVPLVAGRVSLARMTRRWRRPRRTFWRWSQRMHSHFGLLSMAAWKAAVAVIATVLTAVGHAAHALTRRMLRHLLLLKTCHLRTSQRILTPCGFKSTAVWKAAVVATATVLLAEALVHLVPSLCDEISSLVCSCATCCDICFDAVFLPWPGQARCRAHSALSRFQAI